MALKKKHSYILLKYWNSDIFKKTLGKLSMGTLKKKNQYDGYCWVIRINILI